MKKLFIHLFFLFSLFGFHFFSFAQGYDKLILGKWYQKKEQKFDGGVITTIYVQDFLPNGVISDDRQVIVKTGSISTSCNAVTDWQWSIVGDKLYQKKIGVNVTADYVKDNGVSINDSEKMNNLCQTLRDIYGKDILKTYTFKILKIDSKSNVYESVDDSGKSSVSTDFRVSQGLSSFRIK